MVFHCLGQSKAIPVLANKTQSIRWRTPEDTLTIQSNYDYVAAWAAISIGIDIKEMLQKYNYQQLDGDGPDVGLDREPKTLSILVN